MLAGLHHGLSVCDFVCDKVRQEEKYTMQATREGQYQEGKVHGDAGEVEVVRPPEEDE